MVDTKEREKNNLTHNTFRYRADGEIKKTGNQSVFLLL